MSLTLGQFIDNIEKNGYPQVRAKLFAYDEEGNNNIQLGACALGQGCYNTFNDYIAPPTFWSILNNTRNSNGSNFEDYIVRLNDDERLPISEIVKRARIDFKDQLDTVIIA